jgi:hypothetical protein
MRVARFFETPRFCTLCLSRFCHRDLLAIPSLRVVR